MSGIYIKGMEMPKAGNWKTIRIYYDGTCAEPNWQGDCKVMKGCEAVPVPDHGDLNYEEMADNRVSVWLEEVPTIDPVKRGKWKPAIVARNIDALECSECGAKYPNLLWMPGYSYCPNCGASMEADE